MHTLLHQTETQCSLLVNILSCHDQEAMPFPAPSGLSGGWSAGSGPGWVPPMDSNRDNDVLEQIFQIDRQLRTGKADTQLVTLQKLSETFERLSASPLAVDSIYLRLVDFFCSSGNEMRICVIQALRTCQCHAHRIESNAEEMQRRLGMVWGSDDVLGRTLTLKFMAYTAPAMAKSAEAVYRVAQSMRAEHEDEHEAAALAALEIVKRDPAQVRHFVDAAMMLLTKSHRYSSSRTNLLYLLGFSSFDATLERMVYDRLGQIIAEHGLDDDRLVQLMTSICIRLEAVVEQHLVFLSRLGDAGKDQIQCIKQAYMQP